MQLLPQWRREIEALTGGRVVTVPVFTDTAENTLRIPPDFAGRTVVRNLLQQEPFVRQFVRAHALNVNYSGSEGVFHFVLLNTALGEDWKGNEEALLGHEYGHIWLNALGYRSPRYEDGGAAPCVLTHAGDVVHHVLIREEAQRRGFHYLAFWTRNIERWLDNREVDPAKFDACDRVQLSSMYLDTALALSPDTWKPFDRFERRVRDLLPQTPESVAPLKELLAAANLWDRSLYEWALQRSIETFQRLATSA